jgi:hypothetical protein
MSSTAKHRSVLLGASLGVVGTLVVVVVLGLAGGAGASGAATAPSNTSPPTVSGTAQLGQRLHADPGTWSGTAPIRFAYAWQRCNARGANCSFISGASSQDYTLVAADVGNTVRIFVRATNRAGSATAVSSLTAVVTAPKAPENTVPPTISGAPQLAQTLTANPGTWTGTQPITFFYQWRRCDAVGGGCADINGAAKQTYQLTSADVGHAMRVRVAARNPAGSTSATSVPTAAVSSTANGCPIGTNVAPVTEVSPPARLVVDGLQFTPAILRPNSTQLSVRIHVSNTCNQSVQGALVFATAVPYNQLDNAPEVTTDATGWAVLSFHMRGGFPVSPKQQLLALFVRARKPGESVLAGISTRRLISVRVVR